MGMSKDCLDTKASSSCDGDGLGDHEGVTTAAEILADLTHEPEFEFRADDHPIPSLDDLDIVEQTGGEHP